jgi:hypothetical protein
MKGLATLVLPFALAQPVAGPSLETLLERLSSYLVQYEPVISEVIADETMTQEERARAGKLNPDRRRLQSEVAFLRLPGNGEWFGFRLVQQVDGAPVREQPERLQQLLAVGGDQQRRGFAIAQESASHNLGNVRTINMPLLAFEFLHPRNRTRLTFERRGVERLDGRQVQRLDFVETATPTIIRSQRGGDLPSRGSVWVDEATGAIRQTVVRDVAPSSPYLLRATFTDHPGLGILVPSRMSEIFPIGRGVGEGDARYSNFRRFSTAARIVPQ